MQVVVSVEIICRLRIKMKVKKYELGRIFLKYNILMFKKNTSSIH